MNNDKQTISPDELKEAAQKLIELLQHKGHMHMTAIVTQDTVELLEGLCVARFDYEVDNE